ncbi:hypothetical protein O6H91_05G024300 [Diphasiastrum complanatum]|nr:hypothetical protein O6H91_05G024300 [Diphasiastrum complanatum]
MENPREAFEKMKSKLKEISALEGIQSLLEWDQHVYLPQGATNARKEQMEALARVLHSRQSDPVLGEYLEAMSSVTDLSEHGFSEIELASVREAYREYKRAVGITPELQARAAALKVRAAVVWKKAREVNDFSMLAPYLQEWIEVLKEEAAAAAPEISPYDYCLDKFDRGTTTEKLDEVFTLIKEPLRVLLRRISAKSRPDRQFLQSMDLFSGSFSVETQKRLARRFAEEIGFCWDNGRLDESAHPATFFISGPLDVRLTSRFSETDLVAGIRASIHEAGHGLYEQGRNLKAYQEGLPVSRSAGMGIHESQSLLWERVVAMSEEFWDHYWPMILRSYSSLPNSKAEDFYKVINEVRPSLVRVEADEVSYPLHIVLRYEIEKNLFNGSLRVEDIPAVWNQKMQEYIGISPAKDSEGCLQDIHWAVGYFGYFPTYAIGAIYAYQLFDAAEIELPDLRKNLKQGVFAPLREWLRVKVHNTGSLYETPDELIKSITGRAIDPACFLDHLSNKYSGIYDLPSTDSRELILSR